MTVGVMLNTIKHRILFNFVLCCTESHLVKLINLATQTKDMHMVEILGCSHAYDIWPAVDRNIWVTL
jgi:hypothetical protein